MILYHGTGANIKDILREGLRPRGAGRASNWKEHPSRDDCVYLTTAYALYFAVATAPAGRKNVLVVEVDVAGLEDKMLPDEDSLSQLSVGKSGQSLADATMYFRERLVRYHKNWKTSLVALGNCAVHGGLGPERITRIAEVNIDKVDKSVLWRALDPSISIMNFALCGHSYMALNTFLFEENNQLAAYGAKRTGIKIHRVRRKNVTKPFLCVNANRRSQLVMANDANSAVDEAVRIGHVKRRANCDAIELPTEDPEINRLMNAGYSGPVSFLDAVIGPPRVVCWRGRFAPAL